MNNIRVSLSPGGERVRTLNLMLALAAIAIATSGCRMQEQIASVRSPAVVTRFTANPLIGVCEGQSLMTPQGVPHLKVGLVMQSAEFPAHVQFAGRLGTTLIRELQLSPGSCSVEPLNSLTAKTAIPSIEQNTGPQIITVNFQESADSPSSEQVPLPLRIPSDPLLVDQILVVRVIEYRPYFPMLATLEIKVLNTISQEAIFSTTASWTASSFGLVEPRPRRLWRHKWFGESQPSDPSPGHNSPEALMREIAVDLSAWYNGAVNPPMAEVSNRLTARDWVLFPCN